MKISLREYQKEALEYSLAHPDSVCVLPTGTGKTHIGMAWAVELLNRRSTDRVLILEPSRFLVEQVYGVYRKDSGIADGDIKKVYGVVSKEERRKEWQRGRVVVSTPQVALNDIEYLDSFNAVVVDECHRTVGKYAYVKILGNYKFKYKLGLTATLTEKVRATVEKYLSGNIIRWTWEELKEKYPQYRFPDWIGEIYDAELNEEEERLLIELEGELGGAGFCLRTFTRDGALALRESLNKPETKLFYEVPEELKKRIDLLRPLHKLEVVKEVLEEHDFEKAIIFVDRLCVAKRLMEEFKELNPVCFMGRLQLGSEGQRKALEKAQRDEHKLIISTSAGEEGVDLPKADLLIIWSNVASPIRFIQRHGRITRPSEKLKVVVFVATPSTNHIHSPDYDSLSDGLEWAKENGLDLDPLELSDEENIKTIKSKTFRKRIKNLLYGEPLSFEDIMRSLGRKEGKGQAPVERWLSKILKDEDEDFRLLYFYYFPYEEIKGRVDQKIEEWKKGIPSYQYRKFYKPALKFFINLFSNFEKRHRYYFLFERRGEIDREYPDLFLLPDEIAEDLYIEFSTSFNKERSKEWGLAYSASEKTFGLFYRKPRDSSLKHAAFKDLSELINYLYSNWVFSFSPINSKFLQIRFYGKGKSGLVGRFDCICMEESAFLKSLLYQGIFDEQALELVFRNVFYIYKNMKNLIEAYLKNV